MCRYGQAAVTRRGDVAQSEGLQVSMLPRLLGRGQAVTRATRDVALSVIGVVVTFALLVWGMVKESGG